MTNDSGANSASRAASYRKHGVIAAEFAISLLKQKPVVEWTSFFEGSDEAISIAEAAMTQNGANFGDLAEWRLGFFDTLGSYVKPHLYDEPR